MTSEQFIHPKLETLMVDAALAMYAFGRKQLAKGGYFPRVSQVLYKENAYGWPSVVRSFIPIKGDSHLVDWKIVFGAAKNDVLRFDVNDVPELVPLVEEAVSNVSLDLVFNPLGAGGVGGSGREKWVASSAVNEAASLLMRAEALGEVSFATLRTVYRQWELAHFESELVGDLLYPILLTRFDIDDRYNLLPGVSIEKIPEDVHRTRALALGHSDVNPFLASAATHALVLHDRVLDNSAGSLGRHIRFEIEAPGKNDADTFFQALTIATGNESGYAQVCVRSSGWATSWMMDLPPLEIAHSLVAYPQSFNGGWNGDGVSVGAEALVKVAPILAGLRETKPRAKLAARRLRQSSMREHRDDVVIDACIGIEALLGEEHDELVHRMGLRASTALSKVGWDPKIAYEVLKKIYGHRSKIVHGVEIKDAMVTISGEKYDVASTAILLLRSLLSAHLLNSPYWSPAELDTYLFDAIRSSRGESR